MSSSTATDWSVVNKQTRRKGQSAQLTTRSQKKAFIDNMPSADSLPPVHETATIYEVFLEKEQGAGDAQRHDAKISQSPGNDATKKAASVVHKKKKISETLKKREKLLVFDDAITKVSSSELDSVLMQSQASFADNPEVWLKDLASYLNLKLECVPETDCVFANKNSSFPLCKLESDCQEKLLRVIRECNTSTLEHVFIHCLNAMISDVRRGVSTYGYRIFLQLLVQTNTDIVFANSNKYSSFLKELHTQPKCCLSLLWVLGQVGVKDLGLGIRAWLDFMVSRLSVRAVAPYAVDYLKNMFVFHKDLSQAHSVIRLRDYFLILDITFGSSVNIDMSLKKKLREIFPKIKCLVLEENPEINLRLFFPSFLARASMDSSVELREESLLKQSPTQTVAQTTTDYQHEQYYIGQRVMSSMVNCLSQDAHSFNVWRQVYSKHLPQSSMFLHYLLANWRHVECSVDRNQLRETIRSFSIKNVELAAKGLQNAEQSGCSSCCKDLLQKLAPSGFSWFNILLSISLLTVVALITYDIYSSKNFKASFTSQFLERYGILACLQQVWAKLCIYTNVAVSWLKLNVPYYYNTAVSSIGPYTKSAIDTISTGYHYVLEVSAPHRQWILLKFFLFIDWVYALSPDFWRNIQYSMWLSWGLMLEYLGWFWQYLCNLAVLAYIWLQENIIMSEFSVEKAISVISVLLHKLQDQLSNVLQWGRTVWASYSA